MSKPDDADVLCTSTRLHPARSIQPPREAHRAPIKGPPIDISGPERDQGGQQGAQPVAQAVDRGAVGQPLPAARDGGGAEGEQDGPVDDVEAEGDVAHVARERRREGPLQGLEVLQGQQQQDGAHGGPEVAARVDARRGVVAVGAGRDGAEDAEAVGGAPARVRPGAEEEAQQADEGPAERPERPPEGRRAAVGEIEARLAPPQPPLGEDGAGDEEERVVAADVREEGGQEGQPGEPPGGPGLAQAETQQEDDQGAAVLRRHRPEVVHAGRRLLGPGAGVQHLDERVDGAPRLAPQRGLARQAAQAPEALVAVAAAADGDGGADHGWQQREEEPRRSAKGGGGELLAESAAVAGAR